MAKSQAAKNKEFMEKINLMPIHQAAVALFAVDGEKLIWNINTPPFRMKGAEVRGEWQYVAGYAMRKQELYDFRRYSRAMPTEGRNVKRDDFDAFVREQKKAEKAEKPPKQKTAEQRHADLVRMMTEMKEQHRLDMQKAQAGIDGLMAMIQSMIDKM